MRREVTLSPAGHKQKALSFFWFLRGHISPSQTLRAREGMGTEREKEEGASFLA